MYSKNVEMKSNRAVGRAASVVSYINKSENRGMNLILLSRKDGNKEWKIRNALNNLRRHSCILPHMIGSEGTQRLQTPFTRARLNPSRSITYNVFGSEVGRGMPRYENLRENQNRLPTIHAFNRCPYAHQCRKVEHVLYLHSAVIQLRFLISKITRTPPSYTAQQYTNHQWRKEFTIKKPALNGIGNSWGICKEYR